MYALDLNGANIGHPITYLYRGGEVRTEDITMITHKKNGNVLVRHGKRNVQVELRPTVQIVAVG